MKDALGKVLATGSVKCTVGSGWATFNQKFDTSPNVILAPYVMANTGSIGSAVSITTGSFLVGGVANNDVIGYVAADKNYT